MDAKELVNGLNLKVDDFFTVVKWRGIKDNSYRGDCLQAKVIDFPYIRTFVHDGPLKGHTITLNLDQIEIMPLSDEFVYSVIGKKKGPNRS